MWDAASAWFDEQCRVCAQDLNQRNTGPPAAECATLTTWPRAQPLETVTLTSVGRTSEAVWAVVGGIRAGWGNPFHGILHALLQLWINIAPLCKHPPNVDLYHLLQNQESVVIDSYFNRRISAKIGCCHSGSSGKAFTHNRPVSKPFSVEKYCTNKGRFFFIAIMCSWGYAAKRWGAGSSDNLCDINGVVTCLLWQEGLAGTWEFASVLDSEHTSGGSTLRPSFELKGGWWHSVEATTTSSEIIWSSSCEFLLSKKNSPYFIPVFDGLRPLYLSMLSCQPMLFMSDFPAFSILSGQLCPEWRASRELFSAWQMSIVQKTHCKICTCVLAFGAEIHTQKHK